MNRFLFATSILCVGLVATGCATVAGPAAPADEETLSTVVSKAEEIGQLIGPSGFGGPRFADYPQHMGPMMGFLEAGALADSNGTVAVQVWNQADVPCTFHLAYLASYDQLQEEVQDITVQPGQEVTFDLPCAEIVGLGGLTQVGTPAGTLDSGLQLDNQFCVPGFLNSDYLCGGTFACFLSPDENDLDADGDELELVITTQPLQQHIGPRGMMGHGHMMGWSDWN